LFGETANIVGLRQENTELIRVGYVLPAFLLPLSAATNDKAACPAKLDYQIAVEVSDRAHATFERKSWVHLPIYSLIGAPMNFERQRSHDADDYRLLGEPDRPRGRLPIPEARREVPAEI
jgi:hypothetical protein